MNTLKKFLLDASGFKQEAKKHVKKYWLASPIGIIGLVLTFTAHAQDPAHLSRHSSEAEQAQSESDTARSRGSSLARTSTA